MATLRTLTSLSFYEVEPPSTRYHNVHIRALEHEHTSFQAFQDFIDVGLVTARLQGLEGRRFGTEPLFHYEGRTGYLSYVCLMLVNEYNRHHNVKFQQIDEPHFYNQMMARAKLEFDK